MATEGIEGFYVETRNYGATATFWKALGFESRFETGHGSGHGVHPAGGPYVFIVERQDGELDLHPVLAVADAGSWAPPAPVRPRAAVHAPALGCPPGDRPRSGRAPHQPAGARRRRGPVTGFERLDPARR